MANLQEACFILGFFVLISLANLAEYWEKQSVSATYDAWQLKEKLALNDAQAQQIRNINLRFYDRMARAVYKDYPDNKTYCHEVSRIITTRNSEIAETLNQHQQRLWREMTVTD